MIKFETGTGKVAYKRLGTPQVSDECFGSVLNIRTQAHMFMVETHINPSASCTLVISDDLKMQYTLMGSFEAAPDPTRAIFIEDVVHFAAVHPLRLHLIEVASGSDVRLYPPDGDEMRKAFSSEIALHMPSQKWCSEHNNPCDPQQFDESVNAAPKSGEAGNLVAFSVTYDSAPFGQATEDKVGQTQVLYIYRRVAGQWTYCDREVTGNEADELGSLIQMQLPSVTKTCTEKKKLEVKAPADAPFERFVVRTK